MVAYCRDLKWINIFNTEEACKILKIGNKNRSAACTRMNQTSSRRVKNNYVPFRESKLTRLFQSIFCGKGRACMIVNINQCASTFDETLHVMKFSAVAKQGCIVLENAEVAVLRAPKESSSMKSSEKGVGQSIHKFSFSQVLV
ncbi:Kinesin-like protein KIF20A [Acipenser ruthenus]|uniref:Kinesin-like protein KIF20A n=1 Tax=Acipenser ruthenus TaxID=7906 RepID=A0A444URN9_ACIRT|nr:Kinesin-like protein KIF20A [Acipenser ruthenus]